MKMDEAQESFQLFDKDGNGYIDVNELALVMNSIGRHPTPEELSDMIAEADADGDNRIDLCEFLALLTRQPLLDKTVSLEAFELFDKDGDGYISADELHQAMTTILGDYVLPKEIDQMMAEADIDGDGKISCEEFMRMLTL
ncbi:calmodulin-like protein [Radiomyces spectabilis]|uniref:calmodulin-like protein n=1 Tax=Radiomyces spectabilis TaxID=64574 RepID=UPI00221F256A|nr:calmodulin-like protein [Radiomyces spectabilis]KAI8379350.1 calmodulin-like protein [Radiomyces spectabilis]